MARSVDYGHTRSKHEKDLMGKTRAHRETHLTQMSAERTWETSDESGSQVMKVEVEKQPGRGKRDKWSQGQTGGFRWA